MSIEKRSSQFFKVREDLNRTETAWRNIKGLTDLRVLLGPACYRHAGLPDLKKGMPFRLLRRASETRHRFDAGGAFFCCLKQDFQDEQDEQDERGLGAAQGLWMQRQEPL